MFPHELTNPAQANWPVRVNEAFKSLRGAALYAPNDLTTTGLTLGYFGGYLAGVLIADGTVGPLAASTTSYVVAHRTTGAVTHATTTTNWNDTTTYGRLHEVVTGASSITTIKDWRLQEGGILGGGSSTGVSLGSLTPIHPQASQAGTYLDRRGMWRDPLRVGQGTLSAGSVSTITNDTKYNAWPVICRLRESSLLLAYTKGDTHHGDLTGKAVGKIGTESPDGTVTWGAEFTIYDDPSKWVSIYGVSQVSSGRIFAVLWTDSGSGSTDGRALLTYSDDGTTTWASPISLHAATGWTLASFGAGPVVELPNGDLVLTVEGYDTGENYLNTESKLLRSTDGGLNWGGAVLIAGSAGTPRPYFESKLVLLDTGRLLCMHRTSGGTGTHYTNFSDDNGATWSAPVAAFSGYGAPSTIQLSTGTLICTTRRNADADPVAFTSTDRGANWGHETVLATAPHEMEYACPVEMLDGRTLVVFGDQPSAAITNADIVQVIVTEAVTDLRALTTPPGPSIQSIASAATVTPTFADDLVRITAQAAALTLANPTGTAVEGWGIVIRIKDDGTARAITYGSQYRAIGVTLPTTTVAGKTHYLGCVWNDSATKLDVLAVGQEA